MSKIWDKVDDYYAKAFGASDPVMSKVLAASKKAGLPDIQVSPLQGRLLMLLAQSMGAKRILEVGTLGGYSTIWMARALPADGMLVTLEYEKLHAEVAAKNIAMAGQGDKVQVRQGAGADSMAALVKEKSAVRFRLHRRRQARLSCLSGMGVEADAAGKPDHRR